MWTMIAMTRLSFSVQMVSTNLDTISNLLKERIIADFLDIPSKVATLKLLHQAKWTPLLSNSPRMVKLLTKIGLLTPSKGTKIRAATPNPNTLMKCTSRVSVREMQIANGWENTWWGQMSGNPSPETSMNWLNQAHTPILYRNHSQITQVPVLRKDSRHSSNQRTETRDKVRWSLRVKCQITLVLMRWEKCWRDNKCMISNNRLLESKRWYTQIRGWQTHNSKQWDLREEHFNTNKITKEEELIQEYSRIWTLMRMKVKVTFLATVSIQMRMMIIKMIFQAVEFQIAIHQVHHTSRKLLLDFIEEEIKWQISTTINDKINIS